MNGSCEMAANAASTSDGNSLLPVVARGAGLLVVQRRKQAESVSGSTRAQRCAALAVEAIRTSPYKESPRGRHSISARDCADVRTCDRLKNSPLMLPAPNVPRPSE